MIVEGLVTTTNPDGTWHLAPMGPAVDASFDELVLRPFQTSTTFANLQRTQQGVFHVSDDVELLAQAAVGQLAAAPRVTRAAAVEGWILADSCRWYAFRVRTSDLTADRAQFVADVVDRGTLRDFVGFNRAKHAIVEAAILATRVHFLPEGELIEQLAHLEPWVAKTGGPQERRAFDFLSDYIRQALRKANAGGEARH